MNDVSVVLGLILAADLGVSASRADARPADVQSAGAQTSPSEKEGRTPAQQKINSQLLYEIYRRRGEDKARGTPPGPTDVRIDARGRALVDVRAVPVTRALQRTIRDLDGVIVSVSTAQHSILAWVPLLKLERLAKETTVRFIEPAAEATTEHQPTKTKR